MTLLSRVDPETAHKALVAGALTVKYRKLQAAQRLEQRPPYDWQIPPPQPWDVWLLLGGRGSGKTEAGARYVNDHANGAPCLEGKTPHRMAIVAPSHDDAVNTCVRGETGLLRMNSMIRFRPGASLTAALTWPNGAEAELFGTFAPEDVERFRGPQHCLIWGDEFAAWRKLEESWDLMQPGLRLGDHPKVMLTTTPKRRPLLRKLIAEPTTAVTRGKTSEAYGLPADRVAALYSRYGGTTQGRQELDAEIIDDVDGALWVRDLILFGAAPVVYPQGVEKPDLARIVVAVDPAVSNNADSDETGIVVVGLGSDGRGYVLDDLSCRATPADWARRAVAALKDYSADRIVAEANNGGDLVSTVIGAVDPLAPVTLVHASRGKRTRAEPVAALYEQARITHVHPFPELEDQMCSYTGAVGEESPDRLDALVWGLSELFGIRAGDDKVWGSGPVWGQA